MKPRPGEKRENWLLRKIQDAHAGAGDLVDRALSSVLTGRSMAEIAADKQASHSLAGKTGKAFAEEMAQGRPPQRPHRFRRSAPNAPASRPPSPRRNWRRWSTPSPPATAGSTR